MRKFIDCSPEVTQTKEHRHVFCSKKKERNDKQTLVALCVSPTMTHYIVLENTVFKHLKLI